MKLFVLSLLLFIGNALFAQQSALPCLNKKFSVVAHIVEDSTGAANVSETAIRGAFDVLNGHFAPICASFEVCEFRYIENFQYDTLAFENEERDLTAEYSIQNRINVYFIQVDSAEFICGRASLNGIQFGGDVWILKSCLDSTNNTLSHELGHFFGLVHTFEDFSNQIVNDPNCLNSGDGICDTPADPYNENRDVADYVQDCRFIFEDKDANGAFYDPQVSNIMSYYPCSCEFTEGQLRKMAANYLSATKSNW